MADKILVTGATGYVGGRLITKLIDRGYLVRACARSIKKLDSRPWIKLPGVETVEADVFDFSSLKKACQGCTAAYYLVHSMNPGQKDFENADRKAATNMVAAAEETGLQRIIYLGGLGEDHPNLSKHLRSRAEVGKILKSGKVPVTILRAAMIIGSGSASFEILRYLVDRLPVMVTPRWVNTPNQPIAIRNVVEYLAGCLDKSETAGNVFDIGGPEVLTYEKLMAIYAQEAKLSKRFVIPVPVLTPTLSSYWIHLVTPVPAALARPLAEGLRNPVVCAENRIREIIPQELLSCREAIRLALQNTFNDSIETHWTDAGKIPPYEWKQEGDPQWAGGTLLKDQRKVEICSEKKNVWKVIASIGGRNGWYFANWLWVIRGVLDRLIGGVGLRRGRRDQHDLCVGDALDFWRVARVIPESQLQLVAEMKLPGKAILEFLISGDEKSKKVLFSQTAYFQPRGLFGILYWYFLWPIHQLIFQGMLIAIKTRAEKND